MINDVTSNRYLRRYAPPEITSRLELRQLKLREPFSIDVEHLARRQWRNTRIVGIRQFQCIGVPRLEERSKGTRIAMVDIRLGLLDCVDRIPLHVCMYVLVNLTCTKKKRKSEKKGWGGIKTHPYRVRPMRSRRDRILAQITSLWRRTRHPVRGTRQHSVPINQTRACMRVVVAGDGLGASIHWVQDFNLRQIRR